MSSQTILSLFLAYFEKKKNTNFDPKGIDSSCSQTELQNKNIILKFGPN